MKKNAKHALIFAAAIAGGMAAPLRSDASVRKDSTPPRSRVTLSAAFAAPRSKASDVQPDVRSGFCDCGEKRQPPCKIGLAQGPKMFLKSHEHGRVHVYTAHSSMWRQIK